MADMNQIEGGLVDQSGGSIGELFNLKHYQDESFKQLGFPKSSIIGDTVFFKVDRTARLPSGIDYAIDSCTASGLNDQGEAVSYQIINQKCYSYLVNASPELNGKGILVKKND